MARLRLALMLGVFGGILTVVACGLDESGIVGSDGGGPDVVNVDAGGNDVTTADADGSFDVTYDVPDLGAGETEAGLPCTCVGNLPGGYTLVEYVPDQRPGCTAGYGTGKDYAEGPTAAASTCTCTCNPTPQTKPTCVCGSDPQSFAISSGNGNCTDVTTGQTLQANQASCDTTSQPLNPGGQKLNNMLVGFSGTCAPSNGACGSGSANTQFPNASASQGRACSVSGTVDQGSCGASQVCAPNAGGPYKLCITNFTAAACTDPDFPAAHTVGSLPIVDTRSCGPSACTCSLVDGGSCGTPQLSLWTGNNCAGAPSAVLPADNTTCTQVGFGNGTTFGSTRYGAPNNGAACAFTGTFGPMGGLALTSPFTVCCRP